MDEVVHFFEPGGAPCGVADTPRWSITEEKVTCTTCIDVLKIRELRERHAISRGPMLISRIRSGR
jgi:hypothetical protein